MRTKSSHVICVATLVGLGLITVAGSAQGQHNVNDTAVTGSHDGSKNTNDRIDFEHAEALPLPAAPDSVAKQAEKDLLESLTHRNRRSVPAPSGHAAGSEGDGMTNPVELGIPSATPPKGDVKRR